MARGNHNGNGSERLHITETPDVSHIKNVDVTHEASDVSVSGVLKFVLALTALGVVVFLLMGAMFRFLNTQETEKEPPPGPMAMKPEERLPPPPRLQAAPGFGVQLKNGEWVPLEKKEPEAEYRVLREQWERELKCSEGPPSTGQHDGAEANAAPLANAAGARCVPIDQAMEKVVGLPSRVTSSASGPGGHAEDYGIDRPTAASSGRATEKGKKSEQ
jgi:hypothetical protein